MARPRKRHKTRNPTLKVSRKNANKHFKKVSIKGNSVIAANWDKKATLRQNYQRMGLMTSLNGIAGGTEKLYPEEAQKIDMEEIKKTLGPEEGIIERDEKGNVISVIIGKSREEEEEEVFDTEIDPVPAKTNIIRALEAQAANVCKREKYQSEGEKQFLEELIQKYGNNYDAMFRDIKLNIYQHTAAQLRNKCQKYLKSRQNKII
ncbi:480_t:CDS:2 [Funneliformis geosporum]|uniref:Nucleolar protein 16 n=1 Tax=Funneliformis geosporum TaxID=1117311 RepID=A0A9W4SJQ1_9GLOM|nr:480_t:CDS:2 [Funneliformis geosporum]CAI2171588.1 18098_t:CDS:2 [Funneliformis geosporum]